MTTIVDIKNSNKRTKAAKALIDKELSSLKLGSTVRATLNLIASKEAITPDALIGLIHSRKKSEVRLENACQVFVISYLTMAKDKSMDAVFIPDLYLAPQDKKIIKVLS